MQREVSKFRQQTLIAVACLIAIGIFVNLNSFQGAFILDDAPRIVENQSIRGLWPPGEVIEGSSRPLVRYSLALNYAIGRLNPFGYHLFNLIVHLLAGLFLFGIVRRTLLLERFQARYGRVAPWLALSAALLWLVHPLQTNSVTYIIQRSESMMGLFYFLTLYCFIRGATSSRGRGWLAAAVIASALGMLSKAVMATAPITVLLYDLIILKQPFTAALRQRRWFYLGLAATWIILAVLLCLPHESRGTAGFDLEKVSPREYALSQPGVVLHYLRLSLWPHPLVLDYQWPVARGARQILPQTVLILALLLFAVGASFRRSPLGFVGLCFFLFLLPTSSFIPLKDLAFEHRTYLSLAAVAVLVVIGVYEALLRSFRGRDRAVRVAGFGLLVLAVAILGNLTIKRNGDYSSPIMMWRDLLGKRPNNSRAHNNLGAALGREGRYQEGLLQLREAIRISPEYAEAYNNFGSILAEVGKLRKAIIYFKKALEIRPEYVDALNNLAHTLSRMGKYEGTVIFYRESLQLRPDQPVAHNNLGIALAKRGEDEEALIHFRQAAWLKPDYAEAYYNLGISLEEAGKFEEALAAYSGALRSNPDFIEASNNRAAVERLLRMRE